jgi:hypothetical protein
VDDVYGDKALKKTQIYKILKQVKMGKNRRGFTQQKTKMTADLIASVAATVAEDRRVSIQDLARAHGTLYGTISHILHSQLGLVKKLARGSRSCCPHREGGPGVPGKKKDQTALPPPLFI